MSTKIHPCIECGGKVSRRNAARCKICSNRLISKMRKKRDICGPKNPMFKSGVTVDNGYVMLYCPGHRRARHGYVMRSNLVMEKHLGRELADNEMTHHKNGDRADDRIENLQVMTKTEHRSYHARIINAKRWAVPHETQRLLS